MILKIVCVCVCVMVVYIYIFIIAGVLFCFGGFL